MKNKLAKLIDVKSIVTLMLTLVFCALALLCVISGQEFLTIFTIVIGFYFGTQSQKKAQVAPGTEPVGTVAGNSAIVEALESVHSEAMTSELKPPDNTQMKTIGFDR